MAAKFKKIDPRMWRDEGFQALDQTEKLIAVYVITAQSNRIGLFNFSAALAAEDLRMPLETFQEGFRKVCQRLNWEWDEDLRVVYLRTWWRYNKPENPNVLTNCLNDLDDLPQTPLLAKFCANLRYLPETFHETFREGWGERMAHHEHEHEHEHKQEQKQEQEKGASPHLPGAPKLDPETEVPEAIDTSRFRAAWREWEQHQSEIRRPLKATTRKKQFAFLALAGEEKAIEMIETSIRNGWQGLFPPKSGLNGQQGRMSEDEEQRIIEETRKLAGGK